MKNQEILTEEANVQETLNDYEHEASRHRVKYLELKDSLNFDGDIAEIVKTESALLGQTFTFKAEQNNREVIGKFTAVWNGDFQHVLSPEILINGKKLSQEASKIYMETYGKLMSEAYKMNRDAKKAQEEDLLGGIKNTEAEKELNSALGD